MITKIQRWGNSLGVRIPKGLAQEVRITDGTPVSLTIEDGQLIVTPIKKTAYDLGDLLAQITPGNLHGEIDVGLASTPLPASFQNDDARTNARGVGGQYDRGRLRG